MQTEQFEKIIESQIERCRNTLVTKAVEYATEDRLHNFRVAAELAGTTPRQALAGMMAKHTVSIYDMCNSTEDYSEEMWNEKIGDHLNYLLLLRAVVEAEFFTSPPQVAYVVSDEEQTKLDKLRERLSK